MPKRKEKPPQKPQPEAKKPADPRQSAEALLRYRAQPGMRSKRRFINPTS